MENKEQPVNFVYVPGTQIVLTPQEFDILKRPLRMFEMATSVANMKNDELITNKQLVPIFPSDLDENGKIKDEKAFFAKYQQKEEKKPTIVVDSMGNTN